MKEKVTKKKYYKIVLTLDSSLTIGSGEKVNTDRDIILDSLGKPYIPATAIAGVVRHRLIDGNEKNKVLLSEVKEYLGDVIVNEEVSEKKREKILAQSSLVTFYDANIVKNEKYNKSIRDCVSLDEFKTAKKSAKFDMEIVEPGAHFITYVHQDFYDKRPLDYVTKIVDILFNGIRLGGKTTRGYGCVHAEEIHVAEFDLTKVSGLEEWLNFDIFGNDGWKPYDPSNSDTDLKIGEPSICSPSKNWCIIVGLEQVGGISIRRYTTEPRKSDENQPDMEQLSVHGLSSYGPQNESCEMVPVIPGTTWAGAFKSRMGEFYDDILSVDSGIFGYVEGKKKQKSKLQFSESQIVNAKEKILSRNAIDRFSGGTASGALFTEKTYYGGNTKLEITWIADDDMHMKDQRALAASLTDLHFGFLQVGGETSIGRGRFRITSINGKSTNELNEDDIFGFIYNEIISVSADHGE